MRLKQDWTGFCSAERSDPDLVAAAERHLRFCTHRPIALKLIRHCPALIRRRCPRSSSMQRPERAALQALHKGSILPMASHSTDPESCDVPQAPTNRCGAESLAQVRELCTSSASLQSRSSGTRSTCAAILIINLLFWAPCCYKVASLSPGPEAPCVYNLQLSARVDP